VAAPETVLAVRDVSFAYADATVLDHVTCAVHAGEFVALAGGNGAGKSTLLRVVLGLMRPAGGDVTLLGEPPQQLRERWRIGYVPQRAIVSDSLPATVREVVASGRLARRGWWRRPAEDDRRAVADALRAVDLVDGAHRRFTELSGGQQQRVLIAKAMVNDPDLLILDEPIAGVDAASQDLFRDALVSRIDRGRAVLLVSHELSAVARALDRVLVLAHGRIAFDGPPSELESSGVSLGLHRHDLPAWLENQP
jgi:zinc transport system ATP-binding protein